MQIGEPTAIFGMSAIQIEKKMHTICPTRGYKLSVRNAILTYHSNLSYDRLVLQNNNLDKHPQVSIACGRPWFSTAPVPKLGTNISTVQPS